MGDFTMANEIHVWDHKLFLRLRAARNFVETMQSFLYGGDCRDAACLAEVLNCDFTSKLEDAMGSEISAKFNKAVHTVADVCGIVKSKLDDWHCPNEVPIVDPKSFHMTIRPIMRDSVAKVEDFMFSHCDIGSPEFEMVRGIETDDLNTEEDVEACDFVEQKTYPPGSGEPEAMYEYEGIEFNFPEI
jgi:hypothetical protein